MNEESHDDKKLVNDVISILLSVSDRCKLSECEVDFLVKKTNINSDEFPGISTKDRILILKILKKIRR